MARNRARALRRVTDLFVRGKAVRAFESTSTSEDDVWIWVAKPNTFERAEAIKDAQHAAALKRYQILGDPDEVAILEHEFAEAGRESIAEQIARSQESLFLYLADKDLRAEESWAERLLIIDRAKRIPDDAPEEDLEAVGKIQADYLQEVGKRSSERMAEKVAELMDLPVEKLLEKYKEAYVAARTSDSYLGAKRDTEIMYALRDCQSTDGENHDLCVHSRLLDTHEDVHDLDDELIAIVAKTLDQMEMTELQSGNSDAPAAS